MKVSIALCVLGLTGCALTHPPPDPPLDASIELADARAPCPGPFVAHEDECVGWRGVAPPPCEVLALVRAGDRIGVECAASLYVLDDDRWWSTTERGEPLGPPSVASGPDTPRPELIVVELPDGTAVAAHGDVYAHPAAWRAGLDGRWREITPPPSAFIRFGAAVSEDEVLFAGQEAFVFVRARR